MRVGTTGVWLAALFAFFLPATAFAADDLIAFANIQSRVCVAAVSGNDPKCITSKKGYDTDVSTSRDGRWIAYAHGQKGSDCGYQIRVIKPDGSDVRKLTCFDGNDRAPAFTRDGQTLYFDRQDEGLDIWRINMNGKQLKQVTNTPLISESQPVANPAQDQIAFTIFTPDEIQIWLARRNGSDYRQLTFGPADHFDPSYAPDGERIAFTTRPDGFSGDSDLEFIASSGPQPLAATDAEESSASYSPDGKTIVYSINDAIWTMRADGSKRRRIVGLKGSDPAFVKK